MLDKIIRILITLVLILALASTAVFAASATSPGSPAMPKDVTQRLQKAIAFYPGVRTARVNNVNTPLDANPDVVPYYKNNRFMVPAGFLVESMGGKYVWKSQTATANITLNGISYSIKAGSTYLDTGRKRIQLGTAAEVKNGLLFIPVKLFAEAVGKHIFYDQDLLVISEYPRLFDTALESAEITSLRNALSPLLPVLSEKQLIGLLKGSQNRYDYGPWGDILKSGQVSADESTQATAPEASSAPSAPGTDDHSTTNIQVDGVDEGDIVKTDGQYIYQVNQDRILILLAYPAERMQKTAEIKLPSEEMIPQEIYLDGNTLVVVGQVYRREYTIMDGMDIPFVKESVDAMPARPGIVPPRPVKNDICVYSYDITDKSSPKLIRSFNAEGTLLASRKIGDTVYTVTNKTAYYGYGKGDLTPQYRDGGKDYKNVPWQEITYCPDFNEPNYMVVSAVHVKDASKPAELYACLGAGQNIYASTENLYVAMQRYEPVRRYDSVFYAEETEVFRFTLKEGKISLAASGRVPGRILNQFSMDEHQGYFRMATTVGWADRSGAGGSVNNLYVLDDDMNLKGKIEDIAPGEQIYSTRFMGNRAYMVTFKTVDPLFVLDLSKPEAPAILGELKIPGYSNYLHPYDENHILGFGKDAIELESNWDPTVKWAYYQGMKVALFDVTDVQNPVMKYSETIGDRGTDSELLYNHKALLFSSEKELLAFPVRLMEIPENTADNKLAYGEATFQGLYVYQFNLTKGFVLKGRITHTSDPSIWDYSRFVNRGLYIGNVLYTLSGSTLKAHDLSTMQEMATLDLK